MNYVMFLNLKTGDTFTVIGAPLHSLLNKNKDSLVVACRVASILVDVTMFKTQPAHGKQWILH